MNLEEIFSTKIYTKNVLNVDYNALLLNTTYKLINNKLGRNNEASVRVGWQSQKDIYNLVEFYPLCEIILNSIKLNLLSDRDIVPFISSMWINLHGNQGFNHVHVHPGTWYSGVYYIDCSEKSGSITFLDPRPGAEMSFYHKVFEPNNQCKLPKIGDLILFPSWLPHLVEPNLDSKNRISVAFNIELDI